MKILSIRQPWAWAVIHAGKDVENRSWPTKVRGRVLVHASLHRTTEFDRDTVLSILAGPPFHHSSQWIDTALGVGVAGARTGFDALARQPTGGIIGSVEIVDCVSEHTSLWFAGPFGFVLRDPRPLPFIPLRGRLGFFDAPAELVARIGGDA